MDERFETLLRGYLPLLGDEPLTEGTPLRDLGLDSMQSVDLLFAIEDELGVSLPDDALNEQTFATAGSLWQAVSAAGTGAVA
ncbi:acyl carrier protein [Streptomyces sp. DvalAA-14]|uniref:acyl carrier protein n=1 Tax=unclassified Streptomyces TaxID=2593676 RepID=UPI00081B1A44|nr:MULTISPECIES: phosphopantetheine-binding protein [unclassified Streptomyces]MYS24051.1 acyl carrier protein [Streptomyces sp. SID4948]SCE42024.1 acyl carrier protein [Streptomyces sp. DvalAA-14]